MFAYRQKTASRCVGSRRFKFAITRGRVNEVRRLHICSMLCVFEEWTKTKHPRSPAEPKTHHNSKHSARRLRPTRGGVRLKSSNTCARTRTPRSGPASQLMIQQNNADRQHTGRQLIKTIKSRTHPGTNSPSANTW